MYDGEDAPEDEHEAEERVFFLFFFIDHSDPSFLYEESDGLQWAGTTLPTAAPKRGHYVALFIWPDTNFHWIRMDRTGYWSHKPGGTPVRNTDNKGQKIHDPSKSDFSPWTQFCGYMHVIPSAVSPEGEGRDLVRVDIHLDDLQEISTLGYGTYGIVRLVEHQSTGARYALKCISRNEAVARRQQASICAEREILTDVATGERPRPDDGDAWTRTLRRLLCGTFVAGAFECLEEHGTTRRKWAIEADASTQTVNRLLRPYTFP
ncbi:Insoluble matrix shell protein 1 (IMSP1) (Fragment) [Durusdinium trenchii]|uniref:Insoluble matrix shell protein 1 (IMSP1) n=1 Tax=Durusdinium trenchii TaxID=1381693 RepID=A0ABP0PF02_9DINO